MREVERQVMLRIIDQRWREHLEEMDYLKEGINLRAMGQKDPLVEWQREGFEMFGTMMKGIAQDFVRYVMHVQVVRQDQQQPAAPAVPAGRVDQRRPRRRPTTTAAPAFDRAAAPWPRRPSREQVAAAASPDGGPAPAPSRRRRRRRNRQPGAVRPGAPAAGGRTAAPSGRPRPCPSRRRW